MKLPLPALLLFALTFSRLDAAVTFTALAPFGAVKDGSAPSALVEDTDHNFYGTASSGGVNGDGTVFQMTPSGTLTTLYSFTGGSDGKTPLGALAVGANGVLFGTTTAGGANSAGTFFSISTSGTFTLLHSFDGTTEGIPTTLLKGSDGNFYATTSSSTAGASVDTLLKITPTGTVTILRTFNFGTDGRFVNPSLVQGSDSAIYGTTEAGGTANNGTIFRYGLTTNPGFSILSTLATADDIPTLTTLGPDNLIYGIDGADGQTGTIFKMTIAGARTTFHDFNNDGDSDGFSPRSFLLGSDGNFYGETDDSLNGYGTFFRITPAGALTTLYSFSFSTGFYTNLTQGSDGNFYIDSATAGSAADGAVARMSTSGTFTLLATFMRPSQTPAGLVQAADGNFYGVTEIGGATGGGTFFAVSPSGTMLTLASFNTSTVGGAPMYPPIQDPATGIFYGSDPAGSSASVGAYYHVQVPASLDFANPSDPANQATIVIDTPPSMAKSTPAALTLGTPPTGITYQPFKFGTTTLATPPTFFTVTEGGGDNNWGSIQARTSDGTYHLLYSFDQNGTDAFYPSSPLVYDAAGNLYGTTDRGGAGTSSDGISAGAIFKVTPSISGGASTVTLLHSFDDPAGQYPNTNSLVVASNGLIYGTTSTSGTHQNNGIIYSLSSTGTFTVVHNFNPIITIGGDNSNVDGATPSGGLIQGTDGNLYGTTLGGGANSQGTIYSFNPSTNAVTILYAFTGGADGGQPTGALIQANDGAFYGVTTTGGTYGYGGVFRLAVNQGATAQTITFPTIPNQTATATSYTLNATASSGLAVSYLVSGPVTLGGTNHNVLTFTGSGTVTVTAGQAGNSTYAPATAITRTFTIASSGATTESFDDWETRYSISGSAPGATVEKDSTPNLLKYLCDIDPATPMSATDRAALPVIGQDTTSNPGTTYLTLTYRHYALSTVVPSVQTSANLQSWTTVPADLTKTLSTSGNDSVMEYGVNLNGATRKFIRLQLPSP
jgi:uncharacterized repeat protein (TIGR03803 family)